MGFESFYNEKNSELSLSFWALYVKARHGFPRNMEEKSEFAYLLLFKLFGLLEKYIGPKKATETPRLKSI